MESMCYMTDVTASTIGYCIFYSNSLRIFLYCYSLFCYLMDVSFIKGNSMLVGFVIVPLLFYIAFKEALKTMYDICMTIKLQSILNKL